VTFTNPHRDYPVHTPSPHKHQLGYASCGVRLSRVAHTRDAHHITCPKCARSVVVEGKHDSIGGGFDGSYGQTGGNE
jgi:hypothetical protein